MSYSKSKILSLYKISEMHKDIIKNVTNSHKDFLIADKPSGPDMLSENKINISNGFIAEDPNRRFDKSGGMGGGGSSKPKMMPRLNRPAQNKEIPQNNPNPEGWRAPDDPEANDFFDNFKGKSDKNQVKQFITEKKSLFELKISNETDIIINCVKGNKVSTFHDLKYIIDTDDVFDQKKTLNELLKDTPKEKEEIVIKAASLFKGTEEYEKHVGEEIKTSQTDKIKEDQTKNIIPVKETKKEVKKEVKSEMEGDLDFSKLYLINEKLNYPKEQPLWYIYHIVAKSSYGPLSSKDLQEMYRAQMLGKDTEVRFIDVFNIKGLKPFEFFKFIEVFEPEFITRISSSSLMHIVDAVNNRKNEIVQKIDYKTDRVVDQTDSIYNINNKSLINNNNMNSNMGTSVTSEDSKSIKSNNSNNSGNQNSQNNQKNKQSYNNKGNNNNYYNNNYNENDNSYNNNYKNSNQNYNQNYNQGGYNNNSYNNNNNQNYNNSSSNNNYYNTGGQHVHQKQVDVNELFSKDTDIIGNSNTNSIYNTIPQNVQSEKTNVKKNKGKPKDLNVNLGNKS